jgi:uroporphyrinogen-III synthase
MVRDGMTHLLGGYARPDGSIVAIAERSGPASDPHGVAELVLADLAARAGQAARDAGLPRVLLTRTADQVAATALALVDRGLAPVSVPAIDRAPGDEAALADAAARLATFDWVALTSPAAVDPVVRAMSERPMPASERRPRWAAVGGATATALRRRGIEVVFRSTASSAASLADELPVRAGERVLLVRSDLAAERLAARLRARGAVVESVVAYRTIEGPASSLPLLREALADAPAAAVYTSGSTVRGLLALARAIDPEAFAAIRRLPAIAIGGETSVEAAREGLAVAARAGDPTPAAIAAAAAAALATILEQR